MVDNLKEGVEEINLIGNFNKKITNLPKSVKKLNILSSKFNENLLLKNTNIQEIFLKIFDKNIVYDSKFELPTTIVKLTLENFNWQIGFDIFLHEN